MSILLILIPVSLVVAALFLGAFIWSVRSGQFDDTETPALRVLADDPPAAAARKVRGSFPSDSENQPRQ